MKGMPSHPCRTIPALVSIACALPASATVKLSAATPRLALNWPTQVEALRDVRSLVEVELTRGNQLILLERTELDGIMEEQRAVLAGLTEEGRGVAVGRVQGADLVGLCLEDRSPAQSASRAVALGLALAAL